MNNSSLILFQNAFDSVSAIFPLLNDKQRIPREDLATSPVLPVEPPSTNVPGGFEPSPSSIERPSAVGFLWYYDYARAEHCDFLDDFNGLVTRFDHRCYVCTRSQA